ncbi:MAG: TadE/TadG family type IV pilus assembly protein [Acidimicrobiales bacterium]
MELALLLPLLFSLVLLIVQAGLVLRDQLLVVGAAREIARAVAIDGSADGSSVLPYPGLQPDRLSIEVTRAGRYTTANVRYRSEIVLPVLRLTVTDIELEAELTMRDEEVPL